MAFLVNSRFLPLSFSLSLSFAILHLSALLFINLARGLAPIALIPRASHVRYPHNFHSCFLQPPTLPFASEFFSPFLAPWIQFAQRLGHTASASFHLCALLSTGFPRFYDFYFFSYALFLRRRNFDFESFSLQIYIEKSRKCALNTALKFWTDKDSATKLFLPLWNSRLNFCLLTR